MTADTTRREHSGSGIRLGIGSCPGIAKILPAGIRGITLPDGTRVRMLRCVTRENGADIPVALIPATGAAPASRSPSPTCASATRMSPACCVPAGLTAETATLLRAGAGTS